MSHPHSAPLLLLLPLLGSSATEGRLPAQEPPAPPPALVVEYLANEGVLLRAGSTMVLIDGLMGDGLPDYPVLEGALRDSVENALGRFAGIDAILVTHVHRDHFDPLAVARHLRANPAAVVLGSSQVADSLAALAGWRDGSRTRVVPARPGSVSMVRIGTARMEASGVPHPPSRNEPVEHLVWVVETGGVRVMHLGDASPTAAQLAAAAGGGVDLLLAPFWVLGGVEGLERIAATGASRVAAFHFTRNARPFTGSREITALQVAGQVLELAGSPPP